jgi:hypothetical protein
MRRVLVLPVLLMVLLIQMSIVGRITLLSGFADLMLVTLAAWSLQDRVADAWFWTAAGGLLVGMVSAMPWIVPVLGYLAMIGLARLFRKRIWQAPLLAMFSVTLFGTFAVHTLSFVSLNFLGHALDFGDSLALVLLPALLLNTLLAVPVFAAVRDLTGWVYPVEEE